MPKLEVSGLDGFSSMLKKLDKEIDGIIKMGVYEGASIIADGIRNAIDDIPEDFGKATENRQLRGLNPLQKKGLQDGLGIAKIRDDNGYINTKIGFSGYNAIKTKKFHNGQPNILVARSVESGTSVVQKTPFVRKSLSKTKTQAVTALQETIDKEIKKIERS